MGPRGEGCYNSVLPLASAIAHSYMILVLNLYKNILKY